MSSEQREAEREREFDLFEKEYLRLYGMLPLPVCSEWKLWQAARSQPALCDDEGCPQSDIEHVCVQPAAPRVVSDEVRAATTYLHAFVTSSHNTGWAKNREAWGTILAALESIAPAQQEPVAYMVMQKNRLSQGPLYRSKEEAMVCGVEDWDIDEVIPVYASPQPAQPSVPYGKLYEELRQVIDSGNESMTHADALEHVRNCTCGECIVQPSVPVAEIADRFEVLAKGMDAHLDLDRHELDKANNPYKYQYANDLLAAWRKAFPEIIAAHDGNGVAQ